MKIFNCFFVQFFLIFKVIGSNQHLTLNEAIVIEPNYTGLDCYFNKNENCYWTWDADNFTTQSDHKPGQNGFIVLDAKDIEKYHNTWPRQFFGPNSGKFLL